MLKWMLRFLLGIILLLILAGGSQFHSDLSREDIEEKYAPEPSRFLVMDDMNVHYRDVGTGPVLLLLHGTGASLHTWEGWQEFIGQDFRMIRMDLPAYGLTGPHPERRYRIADYVEFVSHFMDALDLDSCYLAGNSLGGQIAWEFALSYPDRVKKLVLLDPAGHPKNTNTEAPLAIRLTRNPVTSLFARWITPKSLAEKSLYEVYYDDSKVSPQLIDRYFDLLLCQGNRQAFIDRVQQKSPARFEELNSLKIPSLILWGQEDLWIPVSDAAAFEAAIPGAQSIIYPKVGHVPMEEIPEISAQDARNFLLSKP